MLGPYIKSRGTRGTKMSSNAALIIMETYVQQGETIWKPVFHIYEPKCKKNVYFGLFWGPWGGLQWSDWSYLAFQLSSHPYLCTCQIRKQSDKKFLSLNPKYEKKYFFSYLGGPGGPLCRTQVNKIFRAVRPHNRADKFITREKNNCQFFIYGPQYTKMCIFGYSGGPGWTINNRTGPILLPSYPLTYINLHIKYGSNPIRIF